MRNFKIPQGNILILLKFCERAFAEFYPHFISRLSFCVLAYLNFIKIYKISLYLCDPSSSEVKRDKF